MDFDQIQVAIFRLHPGYNNINVSFIVPISSAGEHNVTAYGNEALFNVTQATSPGVAVNPTIGVVGSPFTFVGAGFVPESNLTVVYDGTNATNVMTDSTGFFSADLVVPGWVSGIHSIGVEDPAGGLWNANFTVMPSISMNPSSGVTGTRVEFNGSGFAANSGVSVDIPGAGYIETDPANITTDPTGQFSGAFYFPYLGPGNWDVDIADSSNYLYNHADAYFTVDSLVATTIVVGISTNPPLAGEPTNLTAEVLGATPYGAVSWSTNSTTGSFSPPTCDLSSSECSSNYTDNMPGTYEIRANYSGDWVNAPSTMTFLLQVAGRSEAQTQNTSGIVSSTTSSSVSSSMSSSTSVSSESIASSAETTATSATNSVATTSKSSNPTAKHSPGIGFNPTETYLGVGFAIVAVGVVALALGTRRTFHS